MKVQVNAKLNLTLNIFPRQNCFHNIDSIATSVDVFDIVEVTKRSDYDVTVCGMTNINNEKNSAYKAARSFVEAFDTFGVDIIVNKGIPIGAGMGGSSADAAAVIYCMCSLFGIDVNSVEVHGICASLGSDINFMLRGGLGRLRGKGDDVDFYSLGKPLYFVLTTFDVLMSTSEVYRQYDNLCVEQCSSDNDALLTLLQNGKLDSAVEFLNNHLQAAASSISNYAAGYLHFCDKHSLPVNMTGSGSAYYIVFSNEQSARQTADLLNANCFSSIVCKSVPYGIKVC